MTTSQKLQISSLIGFVVFVTGMYVIIRDVHLSGISHNTNAIVGFAQIIIGLCFMFPQLTLNVIKGIVSIIGPYVPKVSLGRGNNEQTRNPSDGAGDGLG